MARFLAQRIPAIIKPRKSWSFLVNLLRESLLGVWSNIKRRGARYFLRKLLTFLLIYVNIWLWILNKHIYDK